MNDQKNASWVRKLSQSNGDNDPSAFEIQLTELKKYPSFILNKKINVHNGNGEKNHDHCNPWQHQSKRGPCEQEIIALTQ